VLISLYFDLIVARIFIVVHYYLSIRGLICFIPSKSANSKALDFISSISNSLFHSNFLLSLFRIFASNNQAWFAWFKATKPDLFDSVFYWEFLIRIAFLSTWMCMNDYFALFLFEFPILGFLNRWTWFSMWNTYGCIFPESTSIHLILKVHNRADLRVLKRDSFYMYTYMCIVHYVYHMFIYFHSVLCRIWTTCSYFTLYKVHLERTKIIFFNEKSKKDEPEKTKIFFLFFGFVFLRFLLIFKW